MITVTFTVILVVCRDFRLCVTAVKISVLCVMYLGKLCCGRGTDAYRNTATSRVLPAIARLSFCKYVGF